MVKTSIKKVLLKLSGEFLADESGKGISFDSIKKIGDDVSILNQYGIETSIVIGAGNIFRGETSRQKELYKNFSFSRVNADKAGMLGTVINGILLSDYLSQRKIKSRVLSNIFIDFVEFFNIKKAKEYIKNREVLIFVGGTSNPYVSTDTSAVIKSLELGVDVLLKATKVDGVYDKDPKIYSDSKKFETLTFMEAIERRLKVMDLTAFSLAMENNLPIYVFNFYNKGDIEKIITGKKVGTLIRG